jgi:HSP20 family protein
MAEHRQQGAEPLFETEREGRRLFQDLMHQPWSGKRRPQPSGWQPSVDVRETDEALIVEIDLPGVTRTDVTVEVEGDVFNMSGERGITIERKGRHYYQMERLTGRFARQLHLPLDVERHAIRVKFRAGILTIILPKRRTEYGCVASQNQEPR